MLIMAHCSTIDGSNDTRASRLWASAQFGRITSALDPRILQFGVKLKKHKALVLCGIGHLFHTEASRDTAVSTYERSYPGRTFVIMEHAGFAAFIDLDRGHQLEARMQAWPRPSLVSIKGTWLAGPAVLHVALPAADGRRSDYGQNRRLSLSRTWRLAPVREDAGVHPRR
jgi:hypothetical protein